MKILLYVTLIFVSASVIFSQNMNRGFMTFNGTNSYLASPNDADFSSTTGMTVEFWLNPSVTPSSEKGLIDKNWQSSWGISLQNTGKIKFARTSANSLISNSVIPLNKWTHFAVTYDAGFVFMFINGILDATSASFATTLPVIPDSLYIGCQRSGSVPANFYQGSIDAIRIWKNLVRTGVQINETMFTEFTVNQNSAAIHKYSGLVYSPDFNALVITEFSSNTQFIYNRNSAASNYFQFNAPLRHIDYNNNLYFDGSGYMVSRNVAELNPTAGITVECWIRRDTTGGGLFQHIVNKSSSSPFRTDWELYITQTGTVSFRLEGPVSTGSVSVSNYITNRQWHHIAGTFSQSTGLMKLYIDGDSVASSTFNSAINANTDSIYVGGIADVGFASGRFSGQIDCIKIWKDVARTTSEIRSRMYRNFTGHTMPSALSELTFDNYPTFLEKFSGAIPSFNFLGNVKIVSSHENNDLLSTSPILMDNNDLSNFTFQRRAFFIPDNGTVSDSILIPASLGGNLAKLSVFIALNHTRIGDVSLQLRSPNGTIVTLKPSSAAFSNDMICIFDDAADTSLSAHDSQAPYSRLIKPSNPLSAFNGANVTGYWKLTVTDNAVNNRGRMTAWGLLPAVVTSNGSNNQGTPRTYSLSQNYPNPFNPETAITFALPREEFVKLTVYDMLGKEIKTLVNQKLQPGSHSFNFDAGELASGMYFYNLTAGEFSETKKMILVK